DDPEAVIFAARTALDFRMAFHKDVMIDLVCFRRHGHNEADEPAVTQPVMYEKIRRHPGVRHLFARKLVEEGVVGAEDPDRFVEEYRDALDAGRRVAFHPAADVKYPYIADWSIFLDRRWTEPAETALPIQELKRLGAAIHRIPDDFELHPRVAKILSNRRKMVAGGLPVDWGCAETLAYASLLEAGYPVRLTGQDSGRGTFFHRHAVLHNQRGGEIYIPLRHVAENQPRFTVIDSILSEEAVVGFEYGYSTTDPGTLVVWEAQFGDFANVAQVVIDQFISSSEQKWERLCGLVLLLPHGWEGQGPEHTSARLERFLQLCSQENIQVAVPTTPAQMFHLLRRQMLRRYRKPLVVMSPKSMLRDKLSFSPIEDLTSGGFQTVIPEADPIDALGVARVVLCSGKVYYDLLQARRKENRDDIAILRVEQLYPFPRDELAPALAAFPRAGEVVWAQEEPMNQGAWYSIQHLLRASIRPTQSLSYTGRPSSAAPAGGHHKQHMVRQERLVQAALNRQGTEPAPLLVFPAQQPPSLQPARS
ncbi:MAG: 2-oxoglutarate dehydrogenase E1 component, partial [Planctomycetes bacterium]|nr:2-oxoglutarate dehydrogenase E1 component [Planctomycetota bacterium]